MRTDLTGLTQELRSACAGAVLERDDDGYADAVRGAILSVERGPARVLRARDAADLAAGVRAAARFGATVSVLATGHAARAIPDADLLVVTSAMRAVSVDPAQRTARIEAGASWGEVLAVTEPHGLVPLSGSHATVGAVGYTLGGGLGALARSHGFAADRVRSFEVVTAAGDAVTVDAAHHPELFRALSGGGRQGIALVAAMTVELAPIAEVTGGAVAFEAANAAEATALFARYLGWTRTVGEQVTSSLAVVRMPDVAAVPEPIRGRTLIQLDLCHVGSEEEAAAELAGIGEWGRVLRNDLRRRRFSELAIGETPAAPGWGGALALSEVTEEVLDRFIAAAGPQREAPFMIAQLRHLGGAMSRPRDESERSMIAGRDAAFVLFLAAVPVPELIAGPIPALADEIFASLSPWDAGALPTNYADHLGREAREASWSGEQLADLAEIRRIWDPAGMFAGWAG